MTRFTSFSGFITLMYVWCNYEEWSISPNTTNVISQKFIGFLSSIPHFVISIIIMLLLFLLFVSFLFNKKIPYLNLFSRLLFFIIMVIGMNMLMLEETTTLFLLNIHHPLGLEYKISYFEYSLCQILESSQSPYLYKMEAIKNTKPIQEIALNLKNMNVTQIHDAALKCVKEMHQVPVENVSHSKYTPIIFGMLFIITTVYFIVFGTN